MFFLVVVLPQTKSLTFSSQDDLTSCLGLISDKIGQNVKRLGLISVSRHTNVFSCRGFASDKILNVFVSRRPNVLSRSHLGRNQTKC